MHLGRKREGKDKDWKEWQIEGLKEGKRFNSSSLDYRGKLKKKDGIR